MQCLSNMKEIVVLIVTILFLIILINNVSAVKLGISNSSMEFVGEVNEKICRNIMVYSDYDSFITSTTKWAEIENSNRDIRNYNLESYDLGIKIDNLNKIKINKQKEIEICLTGTIPGRFNGALLFGTENSYAGIGTWINATIRREEIKQGGINLLTGKAIDDFGYEGNKIKIFLMYSLIVLLFIFSILLLISRRLKPIR